MGNNSWLCQPTPAVQPDLYQEVKCAQASMRIKSCMEDRGTLRGHRCVLLDLSVTKAYIIRSSPRHTRQCTCPSSALELGCLLVTVRQLYCRAPRQRQGPSVCTGSCLSSGRQLSTAAEKSHSSCLHGNSMSSKPKSSATSSQSLSPTRTA